MVEMDEEKQRTVWCGNLPDKVTEEILFELFLQAGPLEKVKVVKDQVSNKPKYAFITFRHSCSVLYTIALMNGIVVYGQALKLQTRGGAAPSGGIDMQRQGAFNAAGQFHRSMSAPIVQNFDDRSHDGNNRRGGAGPQDSSGGSRKRGNREAGQVQISASPTLGRSETVPNQLALGPLALQQGNSPSLMGAVPPHLLPRTSSYRGGSGGSNSPDPRHEQHRSSSSSSRHRGGPYDSRSSRHGDRESDTRRNDADFRSAAQAPAQAMFQSEFQQRLGQLQQRLQEQLLQQHGVPQPSAFPRSLDPWQQQGTRKRF